MIGVENVVCVHNCELAGDDGSLAESLAGEMTVINVCTDI